MKLDAIKIWQILKLPINAVPLPEISKRAFEQHGQDWAEQLIQPMEKLG